MSAGRDTEPERDREPDEADVRVVSGRALGRIIAEADPAEADLAEADLVPAGPARQGAAARTSS